MAHTRTRSSTHLPGTRWCSRRARATRRPPTRAGRATSRPTPVARSRAPAGTLHPVPRDARSSSDATSPTPSTASISPMTSTPSGRKKSTVGRAKVKGRTARIRFSSRTATVRFQCKVDRRAFATCKTPKTFIALSRGSHKVFRRRGRRARQRRTGGLEPVQHRGRPKVSVAASPLRVSKCAARNGFRVGFPAQDRRANARSRCGSSAPAHGFASKTVSVKVERPRR